MKRFRPIILAVIIGCVCAIFLFKEVESRTVVQDFNRIAVQIGVFKNLENAEKMQETYGGLVFKDDDVYRVYYAILKNDDNIDFIIDHLRNKGINYYLKDIKVDDEISDKSEEYENKMSKTREEEKLSINKELLSIYKEVV